jgi:hypothetical protein
MGVPEPNVSTTIRADIARLETGIRQLKIQYDMFFAGALPKEPYELRQSLQKLIRRNSNATIQRYADQYHFNTLVSRFNSLTELWGRTLREREEGERSSRAALEREMGQERVVGSCRVREVNADDVALRKLHARFQEARENAGNGNGQVPFEAFVRGIGKQAQRIREKSGCAEVDLRIVIADNQVQLKARPRKS